MRKQPADNNLIPLTQLRPRHSAEVVSLDTASDHERSKLMSLGVMPGATVHLLQRFPSYVIRIGHTQLALDKETATAILVIHTRPL